MDPVLKRQWLRVLPHLKPADLDRLEGILAQGAEVTAGEPGPRD